MVQLVKNLHEFALFHYIRILKSGLPKANRVSGR